MNFFNYTRMLKSIICSRCKRTAPLKPWYNQYLLISISVSTFHRNNQSPVQMLTALGRKIYAMLLIILNGFNLDV